MSAPKKKGYRRSWKNLLLNKRYQLSFTLFMVGLSAILMTLLGYCVAEEARKATQVSENLVKVCSGDTIPQLQPPAEHGSLDGEDGGSMDPVLDGAGADDPDEAAPRSNDETGDEAGDETGDEAGEETGDEDELPERRIEIEVGSLTEVMVPPDFVATVADQAFCQVQRMGQLAAIQAGYRRILIVLFSSGFLLLLGLMFYGIKMTHRVAGPLHKVSLYMEKMQKGVYDQVYNLRKGDQLVEFYDHFKGAHAGLVAMQKDDIARLEAILQEAEKADIASRSPEVAAAIDELRAILERKEKSLGE